jgi:uncharacterized protein DUF2752
MSRAVQLRVAASAALLVLLFFISVPAEPVYPLCAFHWLTGRPCPLCGLTRALFALGKGHWSQAIHFHALSPLGLAMLFSLFWKGPWQARLWQFGVAAFAVYGVCRAVFA